MSRVRSCKFTPSAVAVGVLVLATLAAPEARGASAKPDLALGRMTAPASSAPGGTFTLAVKILNEGGRAARSSRARVYLAPRARMSRGRVRLSSGARVVASVAVKRLRGRHHRTVRIQAAVPPALVPGTYRVVACVDVGRKCENGGKETTADSRAGGNWSRGRCHA